MALEIKCGHAANLNIPWDAVVLLQTHVGSLPMEPTKDGGLRCPCGLYLPPAEAEARIAAAVPTTDTEGGAE